MFVCNVYCTLQFSGSQTGDHGPLGVSKDREQLPQLEICRATYISSRVDVVCGCARASLSFGIICRVKFTKPIIPKESDK